EERGSCDMGDGAHGLIAKMHARHPHLYGDGEKRSWEEMKAGTRKSITDGLPSGLPSLHRAHRLQDRAAGVGFDWPDAVGPLEKVAEELAEVREVVGRVQSGPSAAVPVAASAEPTTTSGDVPASARDSAATAMDALRDELEAELGDLLFAVVNVCRKLDVHAGLALDRANAKFARRFGAIEELARERGREPREMTLEELDALWDEVKLGE